MDRMKDAHSKEKEELLQLHTATPSNCIDRNSPKLHNEIMESVQLYSPKPQSLHLESGNDLILKDTMDSLPSQQSNILDLEKYYQEKMMSLQHEMCHLNEELEHYKDLAKQMEENYLETQKQIIEWEFRWEKSEKSHRDECELSSQSKDELCKQEIEYKQTIETQRVELQNLTKEFELLVGKYQRKNESQELLSKLSPTTANYELSLISSAFYNMGLQHYTNHWKASR
jgi:hypothetical protein